MLGAMAQAIICIILLLIPSGFLFSRAEELVLNSGNPSGYRWLSGMPFLPFALFGVVGWVIVFSARFINNKQEEVDSSTDEYTKLER